MTWVPPGDPPEWTPPGWTPPPRGPEWAPPPQVLPPPVPSGPTPGGDAFAQLAAKRVVFVRGALAGEAANLLAAQLMALDAVSDEPVTLLVNSPGGPLDDLAPLLDVFSLMGAKVGATCLGQARGTAAALVACATGRRRAGPAARLCLRLEPLASTAAATADELDLLVADRSARVGDLAVLLSRVTSLDVGRARLELDEGATYDAATAVDLGLVDEAR